jgi:hypothetical protein
MMLRRLATVLGCKATEASVIQARRVTEPARLARELMDASLTGMMLIDPGFGDENVMTLDEHRAALSVPQREIVRLETLAESLVEGQRRAEDWLDAVREAIETAVLRGAIAVKSIAAYRSSLRLRWPDHRRVRADYEALRQSLRKDARPRVTGDPLCHALVFAAAEECARLNVPLQVHCGLGDTDQDLAESSPLGLRALLQHERFTDLKVALLHCYPFHREAAYLCSVHAGVHMDLSLAILLAASDGARALAEVVGLCPWSKLLYATDASRLPEVYLLAAELHREALAGAFGELVDRSMLTPEEARDAGRLVLVGNARRLYGL